MNHFMYLYSSFKNAINVAPLRGLWTGRLRLALARLAAEGFQPLPPLAPPLHLSVPPSPRTLPFAGSITGLLGYI